MSDFNFRNTPVYQKSKIFRDNMLTILGNEKVDKVMKDQLNRASLSIILNIAEGYGRFHANDKRNFYVTSR